MQLLWYGHSCFLIKTDEGKRILIDPFESSLGYDTSFPKCDLITISHDHFDHSFINNVNINTKIINTCGGFNFDFLNIKGINSYHDNCNGLKRGRNIIYIFKFKDISLAHLGDLGHIPKAEILNELNSLDFLLIPVGGNFTLTGKDAAKLCKLLMPHYVIPMHYKAARTNIRLDDCRDFLLSMNKIIKINSNNISLSDFDLKNNCTNTILLKSPY